VATRSLWLPIGIHFGWNVTHTGVFGMATSGSESGGGLLDTMLSGPTALTGGGRPAPRPAGPPGGTNPGERSLERLLKSMYLRIERSLKTTPEQELCHDDHR
jgi:hypothetical protein